MKKTKRRLNVLILLLLLVSITIGYSALSTTLNITGTSKISNSKWDVHFANIAVTSGSVTAVNAPAIAASGLSITYEVNLDTPGDYYEFTVDVTNAGSVDAKLNALPTVSGVSSAQDVYTNYSFTHADSATPIAVGETIAAGASTKFKVRVEFDANVTSEQLPTTDQNLTLTVSMNYVQA